MLVTLLLISFTMYVAVDAPKDRGLSYIEVWMIGNNALIVIGIFEYGYILMKMRFAKEAKISVSKMSPELKSFENKLKAFDLITMTVLFFYFVLFQLTFWCFISL